MAIFDATVFVGKKIPKVFGEFKDGRIRAFVPLVPADLSSYPTGGFACDLRPYFTTLEAVFFSGVPHNYKLVYDYTNRKILVYLEDGTSGVHAQVANATDLSTVLANGSFEAVGIGTPDAE